jgi:hypothetical protein
MIREYVTDMATQAGVRITTVSVVEGHLVGCLDTHLLHLTTDGQLVSTLIYQTEIDNLQKGLPTERLDLKIKAALSHLQMLLEP